MNTIYKVGNLLIIPHHVCTPVKIRFILFQTFLLVLNVVSAYILNAFHFSFLLAVARTETDKAAQRLLNSYDLDEV